MADQTHTSGDASALDDDFEWVNAWAGSMRPAAPPSPTRGPHATPAASESKDRVRPERVAPAGKGTPTGRHARNPGPPPAAQAANDDATAPPDDNGIVTIGSDAAPIPLASRRAGHWTSLFRLVSRTSTPETDAARELFVLDAADASAPLTEGQPGVRPGTEKTSEPDQLARDIAEIVARPARSRTSDYVPILVGAVLAFTSLIVFGAAASFVSLR
jgi:hypothetical protein